MERQELRRWALRPAPVSPQASSRRHPLQRRSQGKISSADRRRKAPQGRHARRHAKTHRPRQRPPEGPRNMDPKAGLTKTDALTEQVLFLAQGILFLAAVD